jgi:hypothetical protein
MEIELNWTKLNLGLLWEVERVLVHRVVSMVLRYVGLSWVKSGVFLDLKGLLLQAWNLNFKVSSDVS